MVLSRGRGQSEVLRWFPWVSDEGPGARAAGPSGGCGFSEHSRYGCLWGAGGSPTHRIWSQAVKAPAWKHLSPLSIPLSQELRVGVPLGPFAWSDHNQPVHAEKGRGQGPWERPAGARPGPHGAVLVPGESPDLSHLGWFGFASLRTADSFLKSCCREGLSSGPQGEAFGVNSFDPAPLTCLICKSVSLCAFSEK